jgi:Holliday junction resolvase
MPKCRKGKVVENRIARRYTRAGFEVFVRKIVKGVGEFDILAKKGRKLLVVEVKHSNRGRLITSSDVEKLIKKARSIKAKPVLVLSGRSKLSYPGKKLAKKGGVRIKRI